MVKLCRSLLVLGIFILIILGLNVSNEGINSLIVQNRQPVLDLQLHPHEVAFIVLGESHSIDARTTRPYLDLFVQNWDKDRQLASDYLEAGSQKANQVWLDLKQQMLKLSASL